MLAYLLAKQKKGQIVPVQYPKGLKYSLLIFTFISHTFLTLFYGETIYLHLIQM